MKYAQVKAGNKLHLVYELPTGGITGPVCGIKTNHFRLTVNLPMGMACKNCRHRLNSKAYNESKFLRQYI